MPCAVKAVSTPTQEADGPNGLGVTEGLPDPRMQRPDELILNEAEQSKVVGLLNDLDEREGTILRMRYGLDGSDPLTLKEIGEKINLTRERVRQIEAEALAKIKAHVLD